MFNHKHSILKTGMALLLTLVVLVVPLTTAFAASTGTAGQPNQSCQAQPMRPGNASTAPGSAFNDNGVAPGVYAGTQPQNSGNPMAVSQYDVACFQVSQP